MLAAMWHTITQGSHFVDSRLLSTCSSYVRQQRENYALAINVRMLRYVWTSPYTSYICVIAHHSCRYGVVSYALLYSVLCDLSFINLSRREGLVCYSVKKTVVSFDIWM